MDSILLLMNTEHGSDGNGLQRFTAIISSNRFEGSFEKAPIFPNGPLRKTHVVEKIQRNWHSDSTRAMNHHRRVVVLWLQDTEEASKETAKDKN